MNSHQGPHTTESLPVSSPALEAAIDRALAMSPDMQIPEHFAATVASRAHRQLLQQPSSEVGWGPRLALASGAVLTAALFALAPYAAPSLTSAAFDTELVLFAELGVLLLFANRLLARD